MEQIIALDKELFLYLNNLGCNLFDPLWLTITNKLTWIPLYALLAYLIAKQFGYKKLLIVLVLSALLITTTDQITNFFKDYFQRLRPCHREEFFGLMRYVKSSCGGQFGFSSAHASNHFAIAVFLGLILKNTYKWLFPVLLIWAATIAYSRVYIGVHFPLDISVGMLMGITFGFIYYKIYQKITLKYH